MFNKYRIWWLACFFCILTNVGGSIRADETKNENGIELFSGVEGFKLTAFKSGRFWPPRSKDKLAAFLTQKQKLNEKSLIEWKDQEDWLLAIRRLVFRRHAKINLQIYWMQDWPTKEKRMIYAIWEQKGLYFAGRREFGQQACLFVVLPVGEKGFEFMGTLKSAQKVINGLLADRVGLSLEPLKHPRTISTVDNVGKTITKTLTTSIIRSNKIQDVLYLRYRPNWSGRICLTPSLFLSSKALLIWIQDPYWPSMGKSKEVPLYPPPDFIKNPDIDRQSEKVLDKEKEKIIELCRNLHYREGKYQDASERLKLVSQIAKTGEKDAAYGLIAICGKEPEQKVRDAATKAAREILADAIKETSKGTEKPLSDEQSVEKIKELVKKLIDISSGKDKKESDRQDFLSTSFNLAELIPKAIPYAITLVHDSKIPSDVRRSIIIGLSETENIHIFDAFLKILSEDNDRANRRRVLNGLEKLLKKME